MKKSVLILIVLVFTIAAFNLKLSAQNSNSLIKGKIIDNEFMNPISLAYITIKDSSNLITTISDNDGTFTLYDIAEGIHYIQISRQGYLDTILAVDASASDVRVVNIAMKQKAKPEVSGSSVNDINNEKTEDIHDIYSYPDFISKFMNVIFIGLELN